MPVAIVLPLLLITQLVFTTAVSHAAEHADPQLRQKLRLAASQLDSFEDKFDAQVWLMDMSYRLGNRLPEPQQRSDFLIAVHQEAKRASLSPELVLAVIEVESNFDRFAISRSGARGFMQIMPFWLAEIGRKTDNLFITRTNLRYGCTILKHYLDMEDGHLANALARYNGSLGSNRYPIKVFRAMEKRWYVN